MSLGLVRVTVLYIFTYNPLKSQIIKFPVSWDLFIIMYLRLTYDEWIFKYEPIFLYENAIRLRISLSVVHVQWTEGKTVSVVYLRFFTSPTPRSRKDWNINSVDQDFQWYRSHFLSFSDSDEEVQRLRLLWTLRLHLELYDFRSKGQRSETESSWWTPTFHTSHLKWVTEYLRLVSQDEVKKRTGLFKLIFSQLPFSNVDGKHGNVS